MTPSGRIERWRRDAHQRLGESLFRMARADFERGRSTSTSRGDAAAKLFAWGIVLTPYLIMAGGLFWISVGFPNLATLIFGSIFVAVGLYAMPRRPKLEDGWFDRAQLPELFALTDLVAERLGAQPLTRIYLPEDYIAYYTELRGERVMGFGLALWSIATPQERISIIAHELAHQVNGDQTRTGVLAKALETLGRWYDLVEDTTLIDHEGYLLRERGAEDFIAGGIMGIARGLIELIWLALMRLYYADSQRAEYLADALSTRAGGVKPMQSMLAKLALTSLIHAEVRDMVPSYVENGKAFYARIAAAANDADDAKRSKLFDEMVEEGHSVDMSHPPTFQRISFLADIPEPEQEAVTYPGAALDEEMSPHIERSGRKVLSDLEVQ